MPQNKYSRLNNSSDIISSEFVLIPQTDYRNLVRQVKYLTTQKSPNSSVVFGERVQRLQKEIKKLLSIKNKPVETIRSYLDIRLKQLRKLIDTMKNSTRDQSVQTFLMDEPLPPEEENITTNESTQPTHQIGPRRLRFDDEEEIEGENEQIAGEDELDVTLVPQVEDENDVASTSTIQTPAPTETAKSKRTRRRNVASPQSPYISKWVSLFSNHLNYAKMARL